MSKMKKKLKKAERSDPCFCDCERVGGSLCCNSGCGGWSQLHVYIYAAELMTELFPPKHV